MGLGAPGQGVRGVAPRARIRPSAAAAVVHERGDLLAGVAGGGSIKNSGPKSARQQQLRHRVRRPTARRRLGEVLRPPREERGEGVGFGVVNRANFCNQLCTSNRGHRADASEGAARLSRPCVCAVRSPTRPPLACSVPILVLKGLHKRPLGSFTTPAQRKPLPRYRLKGMRVCMVIDSYWHVTREAQCRACAPRDAIHPTHGHPSSQRLGMCHDPLPPS